MKLLSREEFNKQVFERDKHRCVICNAPAIDAHHIIERKLFGANSGYYLDNGASVCNECHVDCETTKISVKEIRKACNIKTICIPDHFELNQEYDKWGNPILKNGQRLKGEMFDLPNVQKVLAQGNVLSLFTSRIKYPRTFHLGWSEELTSDDKYLKSLDAFINKEVIVSLKMDGEGSTLYNDYLHARSIDAPSHPSRDWLKQFHARIKNDIPEGYRICGENCFARHTIAYDDLETYFYGFSIWNEKNIALSWDETIEYFNLLDITPVPVIYQGIFDEQVIKNCWTQSLQDKHEGYVVRLAGEISYQNFKYKVGKFVKKQFKKAMSDKHWRTAEIISNKLK